MKKTVIHFFIESWKNWSTVFFIGSLKKTGRSYLFIETFESWKTQHGRVIYVYRKLEKKNGRPFLCIESVKKTRCIFWTYFLSTLGFFFGKPIILTSFFYRKLEKQVNHICLSKVEKNRSKNPNRFFFQVWVLKLVSTETLV